MNLDDKDAIRFIDRIYRDLYLSDEVLHHSTGDKTDKYRNIKEYLDMLKDIHERAITKSRINILKRMYYEKYVIKPEDVPDSYYENQAQMALDRGYGHIVINNKMKQELQKTIIENQEKSLDTWLNYFLSDDSKVYPFWAKYWAFQGMLKLGVYNKKTESYSKRTKETVAPFAELNREALALSMEMIIKVLNKEEILDKDLEVMVKGGSFQRIYTYILSNTLRDKYITKRNEGKWVKYKRGSDHLALVNSLKGYNTGWCTAGEPVAKHQLEGGDFYVYYTLDDNDEYKVPRIAIRMQGNRIGEIRGVGKNQNLESEMEEVVAEKLKDFPDREEYYKKVEDMKRLTEMYSKYKEGNFEPTIDDLKFLYETDRDMCNFGYEKDPRIDEILEKRNKKKDLATIFNCKESQVRLYAEEVDYTTKVFYGHTFNYTAFSPPEVIFVEHGAYYDCRDGVKNIIIPGILKGYLVVRGVNKHNRDSGFEKKKTHLSKVVLPDRILSAIIRNIEIIDELVFPKEVPDGIRVADLEEAKVIKVPEKCPCYNFDSLEKVDELVFPEEVNSDIYLPYLKSARGITWPKIMNGDLNLSSLEDIEGLSLPEDRIKGELRLGVKTGKGLKLPKVVTDELYFPYLEKGEGLVLPEIVGRLIMVNLKTTDNITFPKIVKGDFIIGDYLGSYGFNSYKIVLPEEVGGNLRMSSLRIVETLVLPNKVGGNIELPHLVHIGTAKFPKEVNGNIDLSSLTSYFNIELPEIVHGDLYINSLQQVHDFKFPKIIDGDIILKNPSCLGLEELPQDFAGMVKE